MSATFDYPLTSVMLEAIKVLASTPDSIEYLANLMEKKYPNFSSQIAPLGIQLKDIEDKIRTSAEKGHFQILPPFNLENAPLLVQQAHMNFKAPETLKVTIEFDDEQRLGINYELDEKGLSQWAKMVGVTPEEVIQYIDSYLWLFLLPNGVSIQDYKLYKDGQLLTGDKFKDLLAQDSSYLDYLRTFAKRQVDIVVATKPALDLADLPTKETVKAYEAKSGVEAPVKLS